MSLTTIRTSNLDPSNSLNFRNRIINGDMQIDQRNNGSSVNSSGSGSFAVDRFASFAAGGGVYTTQRSTDVPTGQGFINSIVNTVTTIDSPSGTDYYVIQQAIEGFNTADLGWGTASAKSVTVSFWVKSSLTGTYTVAFRNSALNRSYRATYTITSANTWEQKAITIPGDTSGTWLTDNGAGIRLGFTLGAGSDYIDTGNVWSALEDFAATGQTQWIATLGATFHLTGVQLEVGTAATAFERLPYSTELALCQRYYELHADTYQHMQVPMGYLTYLAGYWKFLVPKRAAPTVSDARSLTGTTFTNCVDQFGQGAFTPTSMSIDNASINGCRLALIFGSNVGNAGTTSGDMINIQKSGLFQASAEL